MGKIIEINSKEEFKNELLGDNIILVDFFATWCGPCKILGPILEDVADEVEGVTIIKVNVDENHDLSVKYGIRNIPTILAFKSGENVDKFVGVKKKEEVVEFINKLEASNG